MQAEHYPVAVLCSDIHLRHKPPIARASEGDWYKAQERVLNRIKQIAVQYGHLEIVCAGDIFDKWNSPPELINFALDCLPRMYAVPGQHDLPYHNYKDIHRSAYGTLCAAGRIKTLTPGTIERGDGDEFLMVGFPWGTPLGPFANKSALRGRKIPVLAVAHTYCWMEGHSFPGVGLESHIKGHRDNLGEFTCALFGDNHKGFTAYLKGKTRASAETLVYTNDTLTIHNNGAVMRTRMDEAGYKPKVGILYSDSVIEPVELGVEEKINVNIPGTKRLDKNTGDYEEFMNLLTGFGDIIVDYEEAVKTYLLTNAKGITPEVRDMLQKCMKGDL